MPDYDFGGMDLCQHEGIECEHNVDENGNPECPCPCDACRIEDIQFGTVEVN